MKEQNSERWREVAEQASKEQNAEKLMELTNQIVAILRENDQLQKTSAMRLGGKV